MHFPLAAHAREQTAGLADIHAGLYLRGKSMLHTVETRTQLRHETNPTLAELKSWWETMQVDVAGRRWFADSFPQTYADFVTTLAIGAERFIVFFEHDHVAGSYWLHDIIDGDSVLPPCAWLRGYVSPTYRGNFTAEAWPVARAIFEEWGYRHIFAASHAENRRAVTCLVKNMQFTSLGDYPKFAIYEGKLTTCTVCTMRHEDIDLARYVAKQRSERTIVPV